MCIFVHISHFFRTAVYGFFYSKMVSISSHFQKIGKYGQKWTQVHKSACTRAYFLFLVVLLTMGMNSKEKLFKRGFHKQQLLLIAFLDHGHGIEFASKILIKNDTNQYSLENKCAYAHNVLTEN